MNQCDSREAKLLRVQQLGFIIDDLRLFLDTHPQSNEAFCALQRFIALERTARLDYERRYGPLTINAMESRCQYDWIDGPWPWEMEA